MEVTPIYQTLLDYFFIKILILDAEKNFMKITTPPTGKVRKISQARIRKITGGKDPNRLVEEFMIRRGFNPEECLQQRTAELTQWLTPLTDDEDLEITLEGVNNIAETTLYMGVNIMAVPLSDIYKTLVTALTVADTLIGVKLSLVNYDLVMSVTVYTANMAVDEIDYFYELIMRQKLAVQEAILEQLPMNH